MQPVTILILGAGNRGFCYADYALRNPDKARVVAVAEPREHYRHQMAQAHSIPPRYVFSDWKQSASIAKMADAVIITTPDTIHEEPATVFAAKNYAMLLEKPMAPTEEACRKIVHAAKKANTVFAVCHVLRYTKYTRQLKSILDAGIIGDVVGIQHLEPVGYWHFAHSYVRGNWRNEQSSAFTLLTKSCHDMDWLRYIVGCRCVSISSFGRLRHFRKENKPQDSGQRCIDCKREADCPYSAKKIYLDRAKKNDFDWPVNVITTNLTTEGVVEALTHGPYGRCVYACDNNVVDSQVVNLLFENGVTAGFTMTAFTQQADRKTRIFGTRGEIYGNGQIIKYHEFLKDRTTTIEMNNSDGSLLSGHGGGDDELMENFVRAVSENNQGYISTGPQNSLETHLMAFAAERARLTNSVVNLTDKGTLGYIRIVSEKRGRKEIKPLKVIEVPKPL